MSTEVSNMSRQQIINMLKKKNLTITFEKSDGTERVMTCTLQEDIVPDVSEDHNKGQNDRIIAYDLEKKAWRSFHYDSILRIQS